MNYELEQERIKDDNILREQERCLNSRCSPAPRPSCAAAGRVPPSARPQSSCPTYLNRRSDLSEDQLISVAFNLNPTSALEI